MKSSWIPTLVISSCIMLVAADDTIPTSNLTQLSTCANECLATFTHFPLNETTSLCNETQLTRQVQECLIQHCTLVDGRQFEQSLESSCPTYHVPSQRGLIMKVTISMSGIAWLFTMLKIPVQIYSDHKIFAEDWFLLLAVASQIALATLFSVATYLGFGEHLLDGNAGLLQQELIYMFSASPIYWFSLMTTRFSMVLFLRRKIPGRNYRSCAAAMMAFITAWGISIIILSIVQCRPVSYNWDMVLDRNSSNDITHGYCLNLEILAYVSNAISLFQDVLILLFAIPLLWMLDLTVGKRVGVCLMLLVGLFVCAASALRFRALVMFSSITFDPTWNNVPEILWSAIETSTGNILICLPVLGSALKSMFCGCLSFPENFFRRSRGSGSTTNMLEWPNHEHWARAWHRQSAVSSRNNIIEHKVEIMRNADHESVISRNSHQRLALTLRMDRPESVLTDSTGTREHLNRTYQEKNKNLTIKVAPPQQVAMKRRSNRLASPTLGIFHDIIWRETLELPVQIQAHQINRKPVRSLRISGASSISTAAYSDYSKASALTQIPETRSTMTPRLGPPGGFAFGGYPDTQPSLPSPSRGENNTHARHTSEPRTSRIINRPPVPARIALGEISPSALSRSNTVPSPSKSRSSQTLYFTGGSGQVYKQTILEHQDENSLDRAHMTMTEEAGDEEEMMWPLPEEWIRRSRIRRSNSGKAVEFNGRALSGGSDFSGSEYSRM